RSLQTQPNDNAERAKDFVDTITRIFDKDDLDIPVSIFKVPNSLTQANTEAYVPKLVGLGAICWKNGLKKPLLIAILRHG
ncbi:hypothetical protein TorRG33x02_300130, partial [Trema orientale]